MKCSPVMRRTRLPLMLALMNALVGLDILTVQAANYGSIQSQHARPNSIQILLPALVVGDSSYTFEVVLVEVKAKGGQSQMRAITTITKSGDGKTIRIKDVAQTVQVDATQFTVVADGREFVFEGSYTEPPAADGVPPREIMTTFSQMFSGGAVGIKVRLP